MKKLRTPSKKSRRKSLRQVRKNLAAKKHKRALRSKAKQAHRRGTGFKDLDEG